MSNPLDGLPDTSGQPYITDGPDARTICVSPTIPAAMLRTSVWRVEDFDLHKELYRGKTSLLYSATDKKSGVQIALKLYRKRKLSILNRYQVEREIRIHIALEHENIIKLYAAFEDEKNVYMVQEFAGSGDLFEDLKKRGGQLKEKPAVRDIIAPFLNSISYLHFKGIIHRDIKPENILLTTTKVVKVADIGLSINVAQERPVTRAGTLDYMVLVCPDKRRPEENKDKISLAYTSQVDSWAVGILAFELLDPKFPSWMSDEAKSFITMALAKNANSRPTADNLLKHAWIKLYAGRPSTVMTAVSSQPSRLSTSGTPSAPMATPSPSTSTSSSNIHFSTTNNKSTHSISTSGKHNVKYNSNMSPKPSTRMGSMSLDSSPTASVDPMRSSISARIRCDPALAPGGSRASGARPMEDVRTSNSTRTSSNNNNNNSTRTSSYRTVDDATSPSSLLSSPPAARMSLRSLGNLASSQKEKSFSSGVAANRQGSIKGPPPMLDIDPITSCNSELYGCSTIELLSPGSRMATGGHSPTIAQSSVGGGMYALPPLMSSSYFRPQAGILSDDSMYPSPRKNSMTGAPPMAQASLRSPLSAVERSSGTDKFFPRTSRYGLAEEADAFKCQFSDGRLTPEVMRSVATAACLSGKKNPPNTFVK
eukprot:gene23019-30213_t